MKESKKKVLIIDDLKSVRMHLAELLSDLGYNTDTAGAADEAEKKLEEMRGQFDVILLDLVLEGPVQGPDLLRIVRHKWPYIPIITYSAQFEGKDHLIAQDMIKGGAIRYIAKRPNDPDLIAQLTGALEEASKWSEPVSCEKNLIFTGFVGQNEAFQECLELAAKAAKITWSVLIEGPSGSGKEFLARAIHESSSRQKQPYKPINCAGLSESLLESELFGHTKGSFTGATTDRKGLFEIVNNGTLFLDEIGDMSLNMQAKLLRVLEDGIVIPVGSNKNIAVDVRIISATNKNLVELIKDEKFRQELYFRIGDIKIIVPALKDRVEDIPSLVEYLMRESIQEVGREVRFIHTKAMNLLCDYSWPGNIRELRQVIRGAILNVDIGDTILPENLPQHVRFGDEILIESSKETSIFGKVWREVNSGEISFSKLEKLHGEAMAKEILRKALKETKTDRKTAELLRLSHDVLRQKKMKYGLKGRGEDK
jgi:DNA-binding NtrC family response regulator